VLKREVAKAIRPHGLEAATIRPPVCESSVASVSPIVAEGVSSTLANISPRCTCNLPELVRRGLSIAEEAGVLRPRSDIVDYLDEEDSHDPREESSEGLDEEDSHDPRIETSVDVGEEENSHDPPAEQTDGVGEEEITRRMEEKKEGNRKI
jgi:hypothetical protein